MKARAEHVDFERRLAAARDGDADAWVALYHELAPLIIGYLRAQKLPDAEDVAGEVMLELVRDLHRFRGDAANLRSWVLSIAHHRLLDARRHQARRPISAAATDRGHDPAADDDPEAETLAVLGFGQLEPLLADLTDEQRTVLLLRVIGDLPITEVAGITGKRPGAVKQLQRRAAAALRRRLEADAAGGTEPLDRTGAGSGDAGQPVVDHGQPSEGDVPRRPGIPPPRTTVGHRSTLAQPSAPAEGRQRAGRTVVAGPITPRPVPTLAGRDGRRDEP